MFAPYRSVASSYRQLDVETSVSGASPHKLIAMLFDAAITATHRASAAIEHGDIAGRGEAISRALRIIDEGLKASLADSGGEISTNLRELYDYMCRRLLSASVTNDVGALGEVASLLGGLRETWAQIAPERQPAGAAGGR